MTDPLERADSTEPQRAPAGILNVNKPKGLTSHDVVAAVRKIAGIRRVGHAGTLDPLATGVLIVCVGQATRIAEYLVASRKVYRADVHFGASTDTYDAEGEVVEVRPIEGLSLPLLEETLARFVGSIFQRVPPYSAVKEHGQPLHRRVRRGEAVEPPVRQVEIYRADIVAWEPPTAQVEIECGPGTYIRSLAHEWGQAVGKGAHLTSLTRLASGQFTLENSISLETLREAAAGGYWQDYLIPMDEALLDMEAFVVTSEQAEALRHGQTIEKPAGGQDQLARAYTMSGEFVALIRYDAQAARWAPHKVFAVD